MNLDKEKKIREAITNEIKDFSEKFAERHLRELDDPSGTINSKIHNIFVAELGEETRYYSSLVRSFDSSFGNMLERLAINVAEINYEVNTCVEGFLSEKQTGEIARLLENYKRGSKKPQIKDYENLRVETDNINIDEKKRHESDYYLIAEDTKAHYLIELKIGGDLDNKKARSEKEALLEQYAILSNGLPQDADIEIKFGTAYNKYGDGNDWTQGRVLSFFAPEELLIGRDFWNFICKSKDGYNVVLDQYKKEAKNIKETLSKIKTEYLSNSPI